MNKPSGVRQFLVNNWFLIGLILAVYLGVSSRGWFAKLAGSDWLQTSIVFGVMWMMAAPMPMAIVRRTISTPWPGVLAAAINLGIVPLLAAGACVWLPPDLAGGLVVAAAVPSTLASAAVWTRKAGGDDTVALLVTLITNVACVLVTPFWISMLLSVGVVIPFSDLVVKLLGIVVLPIALAQCMRLHQGCADFVDARKQGLSLLCQVGILLMVCMGSSKMMDATDLVASNATVSDSAGQAVMETASVFQSIVWTSAIHIAALVIAWYLARWSGVERPQRIAVAFSGSQKTLMIGLKLAIDCGVSVLPMVTYHVGQLVIDALIAQRWRSKQSGSAEKGQQPSNR